MTATEDAIRARAIRRARAWTPVRIAPAPGHGYEAIAEVIDLVSTLSVVVEDFWPAPPPAVPDLDPQAQGGVVGVYIVPEAAGQQPCLALRVLGGPKAYLRLWLRPMPPAGVEWGWTLAKGAVCLWTAGELDDSADRRVT